jgi:hypothetical protein
MNKYGLDDAVSVAAEGHDSVACAALQAGAGCVCVLSCESAAAFTTVVQA